MTYGRGIETRLTGKASDAPYATLGKTAYDDAPPISTKQHICALERTGYVMDSSRALAERVERMVAKFVGPIPESDGADGGVGYAGIFGELHRISDETGYAIRKANEALDRLEKELA